ncbi:hypothetical protein [Roseateles violae]|uniref:Uncharacterized protein n=1 Tax=Roseateles violae TaxID=3058042 RepID=A0ABT8DRP2_9BURK|nr:hypothetical protein [Pelomonas sp. PFR6]MDN3920643.1 hypothetical protein [Pelomonas sp. PFR6]
MSSTARLHPPDSKLIDQALRRHLQQCHAARGRWFGAAMLAEQIHHLVLPRFATTVALAALLLILAC